MGESRYEMMKPGRLCKIGDRIGFVDICVTNFFVLLLVSNYKNGSITPDLLIQIWCGISFYSFVRILRYYVNQDYYDLCFIFIITIVSLFEVGLCILQTLSLIKPDSNYFLFTGSFSNTGPLAGYLVVCSSLLFSFLLDPQKERLFDNKLGKYFRRLMVFTILLSSIFIIACYSRMAIVAWILSFSLALCYHNGIDKRIKKKIKILLPLFLLLMVFMYYSKQDSANGRFFILKMDWMTFKKQNNWGCGIGSFSKSYGDTQLAYFSNSIDIEDGVLSFHGVNNKERVIAGCPQTAFNDMLQIAIECGRGTLISFVLTIVVTMFHFWRKRSFYFLGVFAIYLFGLFSYPLTLLQFQLLILVLVASSYYEKSNKRKNRTLSYFVIVRGFAVSLALLFNMVTNMDFILGKRRSFKEWNSVRVLYNQQDYLTYSICCKELYPYMHSNIDFLYEYSYSLFEVKEYDESKGVLETAFKRFSNPQLYILLGDIDMNINNMDKAKDNYLKAFCLIPDRILPLYKLAVFYNKNNNLKACNNVIKSIEKIQTRIETNSTRDLRVRAYSLITAGYYD